MQNNQEAESVKGSIEYVFSIPAAPVTLTSIKEGTPTETRTFRKDAKGRAAAEKWFTAAQAAGRNVYLQDVSVSTVNKRPKKEHVTAIHCAHTDIDAKGPQAQLESEKAAIIARLQAYSPAPTDIIDSGNGAQAFWYLNEPLPGTADNVARVESINRKLADDLGGDRCHDVAHLLRVPGSRNFPNKKKIAAGRVVCDGRLVEADHKGFALYSIDELPQGQPESANDNADATSFDIPDEVDLSPLDSDFRKLVVEGIPADATYKIGDGSRSALTYFVAARLRENYGFTDGEIVRVIITPGHAAAAHVLDQKQRGPDPVPQAMRVIADLNRRGIKRGSRAGSDDFAGDTWEPGEADIQREAERDAKNDRAREAESNLRSEYQEQRYTLPEVCDQWVWIGPLKRFINRVDPEYAFDKEGFNDRFRYLKGDASSVTNLLMGRTEDTIRKIKGAIYKPNAGEFTADGYWNGWRPPLIEPIKGDTTLFNTHARYLLPDETECGMFLNWLAAILQHPETKPRHQMMLVGPWQGTGKTFFPRMQRQLFGATNCQALTQDIIENGFTGWAMRTKFVWIEEVRNMLDSKSVTNKLHTWASEGTITINQKNLPTFVMDQAIAFMLMSNKRDAMAPDNTDRRYLVLRTEAKPHPDGSRYYDALYGRNGVGGVLHTPALQSAVMYELLNRPLGKYTIEGPAPFTSAKQDMIDASGNEWATWLLNHPPAARVVDPDELIMTMPRYLQSRGAGKAVRDALRDRLGGMPWPQQIRPDGGSGPKVRVWLLAAGKYNIASLTSADVLAMYRADRDAAKAAADATAKDDFDE
jgi:Family of unknown function (DUF5906)